MTNYSRRFEAFSYDFGLLLFLIPTITFVLSTLFLFLKIDINSSILPLSVFGSFLLYTSFSVSTKKKHIRFIQQSIAFIAVFAGLIAVNNYFYDVSFDGQWYHQDAIIFLKVMGWNPIYDPLYPNTIVSGENANWVNHYAKASWFTAAAFYSFFDKIEIAKSVNAFFLLSSFFLSYSFLIRRCNIRPIISIILAFLLAFSPTSWGQVFSFYIDGQLSSLLLILLIFLLDHLEKPSEIKYFMLMSLAFVYFVNLKFTALVYAMIILGAAFLWIVFKIKDRSLIKKYFIRYTITALLGVLFFGYPTYVRNTIEKNHPFYPLMGKDNIGESLAQISYPINFFDKNRFEKFYLSTFAVPQYTAAKDHPSLPKSLFNFKHLGYYMEYYRNHQPVSMSPLGPLYGEFVVLLLPFLILIGYFYRKNWAWWFLTITCIISLLIFPDFWIYRYSPQLYFLYFIFIIFGLISSREYLRNYSAILLVVMLASIGINNYCNLEYNIWRSREVHQEFKELSDKKLIVERGWMKSFQYRLIESGLNYSIDYSNDTTYKFIPFKSENATGWKYMIVKDSL